MKISLNSALQVPSSPVTLPSLRQAVTEAFRYQNVKVLDADQVDERSILGTPIFMSLTFEEINVDGYPRVPKFHIPCVIVTVSFAKTIVKTIVQGQRRRNSFKEHITFGDYAVNIKGILSNDDSKYPMDKVDWLNQICLAPVAVEITHRILNRMGIYQLVIEAGDPIVENQGKQNIQPFMLSCVDDLPVKLVLKNEQEARTV